MQRNSISRADLIQSAAPVSQAVAAAARHLGRCTTEHVLNHLGLPLTRANEMDVAAQLRQLGYTRNRTMIRGVRTYVFTPSAD